MPVPDQDAIGPDRSLLICDDDEQFLHRLGRAMEKRGFAVTMVDSVAAGRAAVGARPPAYAVVDLRLEDGNGLDLVALIRERRPDARIVVLTGYGAIASAVAAVKIGATDYLAKPADANDVTGALLAQAHARPEPPENPMSRRPGALGAHPAGLRALRPQRLGDRPAAEHAPPHAAAHPRQAQPAVTTAGTSARRTASTRSTRFRGHGPGLDHQPRPRRRARPVLPPIPFERAAREPRRAHPRRPRASSRRRSARRSSTAASRPRRRARSPRSSGPATGCSRSAPASASSRRCSPASGASAGWSRSRRTRT